MTVKHGNDTQPIRHDCAAAMAAQSQCDYKPGMDVAHIPLLNAKDYTAASVFRPENLLRAARVLPMRWRFL